MQRQQIIAGTLFASAVAVSAAVLFAAPSRLPANAERAAGAVQVAEETTASTSVPAFSSSSTPQIDAVVEAARQTPTLTLFHSPTCPHCRAEIAFLDRIKNDYPNLVIERYVAEDPANLERMIAFAKGYGAERFLGQVPLTFIGDKHFVGYESDDTTGKDIEAAIRATLGTSTAPGASETQRLYVPFLGSIDPSAYSFPVLAILLGFLDGFNVCSLGALVLIIGLSLKLQNRRAIILFGGTYILVTSVIYGTLIVAWYKFFQFFAGYMTLLKGIVALMGIGGGAYFLREYLRMRKKGALCQMTESPLIARMMHRTGKVFEDTGKMLTIVGSIFVFAAVITIVEFPCSAAVPVVFAGILAHAQLSPLAYLGYISLYIVLYMLDELIVFAVAAARLKLWMTSGKFTIWAVLVEALVLLGIGVWYLGGTLGIL